MPLSAFSPGIAVPGLLSGMSGPAKTFSGGACGPGLNGISYCNSVREYVPFGGGVPWKYKTGNGR
jgi:hypothetical protein